MIYIILRDLSIQFLSTSNFKQILNNLGYNRIKRSYAIKVFDKLFDFQLRTYVIIIFVTV